MVKTIEPYASYLEKLNWIKADIERANEQDYKGDKELAKAILAEAAKHIVTLNEQLVLRVLE